MSNTHAVIDHTSLLSVLYFTRHC